MRLIDADALKAEWYRLNDINEEDHGARFVGYREITRLIDNAPTVQPTSDLISRADAIARIANDNVVGGMKRINEYRDSTEHNDYLDGISTAIATVDDLPSADAVHGEWIHDGQNFKGGLDWCHCSECGYKTSTNGLSVYRYCPNCGARMKGGAEE